MTAPPVFAPDRRLLMIGKGQMFFAPQKEDGSFEPYYHMGNIREAAPTNEDTRLDVKSSMSAGAPLYDSVLKERKITVRALFEEFSKLNARLITMSSEDTIAAQAATAVVDEVLMADVPATTLGGTLGGRIFFTAKYGPATAITVSLGGAALTLGTDYQIVQNVKGQVAVQILPGSTEVTNGADDLTISYTPTAYAAGFNTLNVGQAEEIKGKLKFQGDPTKGPVMAIDWWLVSVNPTGVLNLISEDLAQGELLFTVLEDTVNHPDNPLGQVVFTG
jgi:hypothetical protein